MKRRPVIAVAFTALAAVAALAFAMRKPTAAISAWVGGPAFNRMLSQSVSHALKIDGQFGPISLDPDWSISARNFHGKGWPGQAIASLDSGGALGKFSPWGLLRGEWLIPTISLEKLDLLLATPDDALKAQDPILPPKPWYAFLMPSQFHCNWIDCPVTSIGLPLGTKTVRAEHQHVGATMIGQNFKYYGKGGLLHYPGYPAMAVDSFEVYVTREMIDIGYLYLREPQSPRSNLQLALKLGQHAGKSIKASAKIDSLDITPFLPSDVAAILDGTLSGTVAYATDSSGKNVTGGGAISLSGAALRNWKYLDHLADRSGDQSFRQIALTDVSVGYALEGDLIRAGKIAVRTDDGINVSGSGSWNARSSAATINLEAGGIPLGAYLPPSMTGNLRGVIGGAINWSWQGTDIARGSGGGTLQLQNTKLSGFTFQKFLDRFFKTRDYAEMELTAARCRWHQDATGLYLEDIDVLVPGRAGLRGALHVAPDGALSGTIVAGLPASALRWLPDATTTVFARSGDGLHWCSIKVRGTEHKPETDFTAQILRQLEKHPAAMAEMAARGVSWWLGDMLHTEAAEKAG